MNIDINILWIITVVLLVWGGISGFKRGLVEGVIHVVSFVLGLAVLIVLAKGIGCFIQGNLLNVLMALILLVVIRIFHQLTKLLLDSCRLISRLPVVKWLDRLAGMLLGVTQALCIIWIIFSLCGYFNFGHLNAWILAEIRDSMLLSMIYHTNLIIRILQFV